MTRCWAREKQPETICCRSPPVRAVTVQVNSFATPLSSSHIHLGLHLSVFLPASCEAAPCLEQSSLISLITENGSACTALAWKLRPSSKQKQDHLKGNTWAPFTAALLY